MATPAGSSARPQPEYLWPWVLCVLGVDYFSTLAYQPSITYQVAGRLGPIATLVVVLITLAGALPVYWYVAGKSPHGQGSIALLERLVHGWRGKSLVLVLLGFAATDFIMVKTISLADAAVHLIGNPYAPWQDALDRVADWSKETTRPFLGQPAAGYFDKQLVVTLVLGVLGFTFWFLLRRGFTRNVIVLAVPLVCLYVALTSLIVVSGLYQLWCHPHILSSWLDQVRQGDWQIPQEEWFWPGTGSLDAWGFIALFSVLLFPRLSLGLSGFEMSLILMPQIKGAPGDDPHGPKGRIRNTRKVLVSAALIMSLLLIGSVLVTGLLIPAQELQMGGQAANRALAYLAHGGRLHGEDGSLGPLFGSAFGTLYDVTTILLLSLAGTSVMTALAVLLPQFLLRFGMELRRTQRWGVLLIVFGVVNLAVTLWFRASVTAQRGAYATGVLVLFTSASFVAALDRGRHRPSPRWRRLLSRDGVVALFFAAATVAVLVRTPSGLLIAACFIAALFAMSVIVRALRTGELRTVRFEFKDEHSRFLWDSLRVADFPVLVPHRPGRHERELKEVQIRRDHQLDPDADVVFIEIEVDDPSNFLQNLLIEVFQEDRRFVIKVTRCCSVAHAIAAIALEMSKLSKPPGLHFGWSEMDLMTASWSYFAFGEGNVPWKVRELILRAEPDPERRPRVIIG